ncbi:hypothetical protein JIX56_42995 [Streptomyces sp. CA-210063]|uniref:hypothetical protein n=1 Tax=Streptomyces sp. CA-210063 TaxID=2801029 RepID=UPI00214CC775|nr:hypothetical protein [Streptomyces sp. CA-210063]UUU36061.1 hypothetical protein JIX56_42995 [Streptomyces sp. CA-210063]
MAATDYAPLTAEPPRPKAFGEQRGPHVVAAFDPTRVSDAQLARAARQSGVSATGSTGPRGPYVPVRRATRLTIAEVSHHA